MVYTYDSREHRLKIEKYHTGFNPFDTFDGKAVNCCLIYKFIIFCIFIVVWSECGSTFTLRWFELLLGMNIKCFSYCFIISLLSRHSSSFFIGLQSFKKEKNTFFVAIFEVPASNYIFQWYFLFCFLLNIIFNCIFVNRIWIGIMFAHLVKLYVVFFLALQHENYKLFFFTQIDNIHLFK